MDVILKYEPVVVGIYCKLITMSSGKSLSIDWLSKRLAVSKEKMRKTIVFLESEGYITRKPIRDENGRMCGWNYILYPEPVSENHRTKAGVKTSDLFENRVMDSPCYGISDNTVNPKDNNIDNISSINTPDKKEIEKVPNGTKKTGSLTDEEKVYIEKMKERYPRIMRMEQPLTLAQAKKLKEKYDKDLIAKIMDDMEN